VSHLHTLFPYLFLPTSSFHNPPHLLPQSLIPLTLLHSPPVQILVARSFYEAQNLSLSNMKSTTHRSKAPHYIGTSAPLRVALKLYPTEVQRVSFVGSTNEGCHPHPLCNLQNLHAVPL